MNEIPKCQGRYRNVAGEFGQVIDQQCAKCQRRSLWSTMVKRWIRTPDFEGKCPERIDK